MGFVLGEDTFANMKAQPKPVLRGRLHAAENSQQESPKGLMIPNAMAGGATRLLTHWDTGTGASAIGTAWTDGDIYEEVGWLTPTGFSDLSANNLIGRAWIETATYITTGNTLRLNLGADNTGTIYLVSASGSGVTATSTGVTITSGQRFKYYLKFIKGTSVAVTINDTTTITITTNLPTYVELGGFGWGSATAAVNKSQLYQPGEWQFTAVS